MAGRRKGKKENQEELRLANAIRDENTKAISIVDRAGLNSAKEHKQRVLKDIQAKDELSNRISNIEQKLDQLFTLLVPEQNK